jgi:hypothetical protein
MQTETDDEVYRVESVWLGPPRVTLPFAARYVAWGVGTLTFFVAFSAARFVLGAGLSFFTIAWTLIVTVLITRLLTKMINYEKPLTAVVALFRAEVAGPRRRTKTLRSITGAARVRFTGQRPRRRRDRANYPEGGQRVP